MHQELQRAQQYKDNFILQCLHAHIRWESTHVGGSRTFSIGLYPHIRSLWKLYIYITFMSIMPL